MSTKHMVENAAYLGLDIGSGSVGWAVTDEEYGLCRARGKDMWGVRLFESAQTAQERRGFRVARRRLQRRNQRLALLQEIFSPHIQHVDPGFFQRMMQSRILPRDKAGKYTLFADENFNDCTYHRRYPTIYHLRLALMRDQETEDVRLVYLALHHILKHRGHFLTADLGDGNMPELEELLAQCSQAFMDELDLPMECADADQLRSVLLNREMKNSVRQKALQEIFSAQDSIQKEWIKALSGANASLARMFDDPALEGAENEKICFSKSSIEDELPQLEELLGERMYLLEIWRSVYNWAVLKRLLGGYEFLSEAKVAQYEQNAADLAELKRVLRRYGTKEMYAQVFLDLTVGKNYCNLVGHGLKRQSGECVERCSHDEFCKFVESVLKKLPQSDEVQALLDRATRGELLPRLICGDNSVIPYQLHRIELDLILQNASRKLPFLNEPDEEGLTPAQKIRKLLEFRIPYYVGPLNENSPFSWFVRREPGKIYPWNLERKVDLTASAEKFINRMTGKCSYLRGADVLPACAPLYERFKVLNEINPMTLRGQPISVALKQEIYEHVFERTKKPTIKTLLSYLNARGYDVCREDIGGIDVKDGVKSNLRTTILLRDALDRQYTPALAEEIVASLTCLGEDRRLLRQKLCGDLGLSEEIVQRLMRIRCTGWGRLSADLLQKVHATVEGHQSLSLIEAMWETNQTFAALLAESYGFRREIDRQNRERGGDDQQEFIQELYVSPAVRRQIRQTLTVVRELRKIIGHDPRKVFVEMARGSENSKPDEDRRKVSRKRRLCELYQNIKDVPRELCELLDRQTDQDLRRDKLYLYFTQMCKCMYSGEPISLSELFDENKYDIDHIYPRCFVKDDSLDNRVLVKRQLNQDKTNRYPLDSAIQRANGAFWKNLYQRGLITKTKYDRLTRQTGFTEEERTQFIARQLVETRQGTKAVAELLKHMLPDSDIVYVKAGNVSDFRRNNKMVKLRELNDLHHARDAYLNIVVGNVYDTKFTRSPAHFVKELRETYNLGKMFDFPVIRGNVVAWIPGEGGTLDMVRQMMAKNSILVTHMAVIRSGEVADAQPLPKGNGQLPLKKGLPIEDYGGYNKVKGAYFMLVEYVEKKKRVRALVDVPRYLKDEIQRDIAAAEDYCRQGLGLAEARVILPVVRYKSLLNIDGFRMYLSGRTNDRLIINCAHQLLLGEEEERYLKRVMKFTDNAAEYARTHRDGEYKIVAADKITPEENLHLYDVFTAKLENPPYGIMLKKQAAVLRQGRERFIALPTEGQCALLCQILKLLTRTGNRADLREVGGVANAGVLLANSRISNYQRAEIIYQSPTGLIEKTVDLLK